jgi:hypothetical protein
MNLYRLALKNIVGSAFRSWVVALCALLVASLALATTLIMRSAENSLRLAIDRLGADIVVVPEGTASRVESALLMGMPVDVWMPTVNLAKIPAVPGVQVVSPQLYLSTLTGAACCAVEHMFLIAYDPQTDFVVEPWLSRTWATGSTWARRWAARTSLCRRASKTSIRVPVAVDRSRPAGPGGGRAGRGPGQRHRGGHAARLPDQPPGSGGRDARVSL